MFMRRSIIRLLSVGFSFSFARAVDDSSRLNDLLVKKAMPLDEYEDMIVANGGEPFRHKLNLDSDNEDVEGRKLGNDDDAYSGSMMSFQNYALKYATCQKVQRFSMDAVLRGEYSSMITDNIVILRLCPKRSCNSNSRFGCSSGYGEYALDVNDYMEIVMTYQDEKQSKFCSFCSACGAGGSYYNGTYSNNAYQATYNYGDDDYSSGATDSNTCYQYANKCKNAASYCATDDDTSGTNYLNYLNYLGCQEIAGDSSYFFVSPHCDSSNAIAMGIFYDEYCDQYAGDDVDIYDIIGSDFDMDTFESVQKDVGCLDCGQSAYPPFYNTHNTFCNNIYQNSGQCDDYLAYDIGKQSYDDDTSSGTTDNEAQCSFIESIRYGTYDSYGEINVQSYQTGDYSPPVTVGQKVSVVLLSLITVGLAVYSCVLHHQMTNLLLKSLSSGLIGSKKRWRRRQRRDEYSLDGSTVRSGSFA